MSKTRPGAEWNWYENPFAATQAFRGLIVAQMILDSWDLMVRDLGSSLGHSKQGRFFSMLNVKGQQGSKNDLEGFERQGFIKKVEGTRVEFDYRGMNSALVKIVTPPDVVWACELLSRLPDTHWQAAFRAGAYTPDQTDRYIRKIKEKVAQGLALKTAGTR